MTAAERRALLGDEAVEDARSQSRRAIAQAPPDPGTLARLRRILTNPGRRPAPVAARQAA